MSYVEIQRKKSFGPTGEVEVYAIPAVSIHSPQGKKLIPNPHGNEAMVFGALDDAVSAIKRAGFDYIFEGKKVSTQDIPAAKSTFLPLVSGSLSLQKAVPLLIERLNDRESAVIANAIFALGELHAAEALPAFSKILGHDDPNVRKNIAEAMAKIGEPAIPVLQEAFRRPGSSSHVRLTILSACLEIAFNHKELLNRLLPQVVESLQDEHWLIRAQAALVLGHAAAQLSEEE